MASDRECLAALLERVMEAKAQVNTAHRLLDKAMLANIAQMDQKQVDYLLDRTPHMINDLMDELDKVRKITYHIVVEFDEARQTHDL